MLVVSLFNRFHMHSFTTFNCSQFQCDIYLVNTTSSFIQLSILSCCLLSYNQKYINDAIKTTCINKKTASTFWEGSPPKQPQATLWRPTTLHAHHPTHHPTYSPTYSDTNSATYSFAYSPAYSLQNMLQNMSSALTYIMKS